MQLKLLFLFPLLMFVSCASKERKACNPKGAFTLGLENGLAGKSKLEAFYSKRCSNKAAFKEAYAQGYKEGSLKFCSIERGQSQALYALPKEVMCKDITPYSESYQKTLLKECTSQKALLDVKSHLNTTNKLCKNITAYKTSYIKELKIRCSFKKGRSIGYSKKSSEGLCQDSHTLSSFLSGHKKGLQIIHLEENRQIEKTLKKVRLNRNSLKRKLNKISNSQERIELKLKISKLESQILELQSTYEKNKKFIKK